MPVYIVPVPGGRGPQFHVVCDRQDCGNAVLMAPGKSRQRAIDVAKSRGFQITGAKGAEIVVCPACANPHAASSSG